MYENRLRRSTEQTLRCMERHFPAPAGPLPETISTEPVRQEQSGYFHHKRKARISQLWREERAIFAGDGWRNPVLTIVSPDEYTF
jgi:hypothetical protein